MSLDYRSVIVACGLLNILVAIVLWTYALSLRPQRPEIYSWATSYAVMMLGSILIALRGAIPDFLSVVVGNCAIVAFFVGTLAGIRFFLGKPPRWPQAAVVMGVFGPSVAVFAYAIPSFPARFHIYDAVAVLILSASAVELARGTRRELGVTARLVLGIIGLLAFSFVLRSALGLVLGLSPSLMEGAGWDAILQLLQASLVAVLSLALVLLRAESLNAELARAVEGRELLVREMAHRTKNDLALVDSLISLEQGALGSCPDPSRDTPALGVDRLEALRERIRCMARAHERLSVSKDLRSIRLDEYLEAVAASLPTRPGVEVVQDFAAAEVPFALASPLGLVMNELAVNALKYAFPGGRSGKLSLALRPEDGGRALRLEVRDDGVGTAWPSAEPGLGSMIVESFASQLGGELDFSSQGGSTFGLVFPLSRP